MCTSKKVFLLINKSRNNLKKVSKVFLKDK